MATYEDGKTEAMVGDVVERIVESIRNAPSMSVGTKYVVNDVLPAHVHVDGYWCPGNSFKLISRAPSPPHEPLVKWPEEKQQLRFEDLPDKQLFAWRKCPDMPCLKDGHHWLSISNHSMVNDLLFGKDDEVRRIQFNPDNKEPVFVVI